MGGTWTVTEGVAASCCYESLDGSGERTCDHYWLNGEEMLHYVPLLGLGGRDHWGGEPISTCRNITYLGGAGCPLEEVGEG
jgi:hypothetical protein